MKKENLYTYVTILFLVGSAALAYVKFTPSEQEAELLQASSEANEHIRGESLNFPEELYPVNSAFSLAEFSRKSAGNYMLVVIDGDCHTCIGELAEWDTYLQKNPGKNPVFILEGQNKFAVNELINNDLKFPYPVYHDMEKYFIQSNRVSHYKSFRTFHLQNNRVSFVGSPLTLENTGLLN